MTDPRTTLQIGMDWAGPGGDATAIVAVCPACNTVHCATLERDAELLKVAASCSACGAPFHTAEISVERRR